MTSKEIKQQEYNLLIDLLWKAFIKDMKYTAGHGKIEIKYKDNVFNYHVD
jgi:hypothetical protein